MSDLTNKLQQFAVQLEKVHTPDKTIWWHGYDSTADIFEVIDNLINLSIANDKDTIKEYRRQKLLELYSIEINKSHFKNDPGWFCSFHVHGEEYETGNFLTRREAEDQAIADYESISETGTK